MASSSSSSSSAAGGGEELPASASASGDVLLSLDGDALVRFYGEFKAVWDAEGRGLTLTEFVSCVLSNTAPRAPASLAEAEAVAAPALARALTTTTMTAPRCAERPRCSGAARTSEAGWRFRGEWAEARAATDRFSKAQPSA